MAPMVADTAALAPRERVQNPLRPGPMPMAKVDPKNLQERAKWAREADALDVGIRLARKTRKEAAGLVDASEPQVSAWCSAVERPQMERFEHHPVFAASIAVARALQKPDVFEVRWSITARV
jgi:hypothetical protein